MLFFIFMKYCFWKMKSLLLSLLLVAKLCNRITKKIQNQIHIWVIWLIIFLLDHWETWVAHFTLGSINHNNYDVVNRLKKYSAIKLLYFIFSEITELCAHAIFFLMHPVFILLLLISQSNYILKIKPQIKISDKHFWNVDMMNKRKYTDFFVHFIKESRIEFFKYRLLL